MRIEREVVGSSRTSESFGMGGVVEQDRAEDRLLCVHVRGESAIESDFGEVAI